MAYFKSFSDLAEDLGGEAVSFADKIGEASINFACTMWEIYPDRLTNNRSLGTSIIRGAMTELCNEKQPPPLSIPPECEAIMLIFGTYTSKNLSAGGCDVTAWWRSKSGVPLSDLGSNTPVELSTTRMGLVGKSGAEYDISRISQAQFDTNDLVNQSTNNNILFRAEGETCTNRTIPGDGHSFIFEKVVQQNILPESCNDDVQFPVSSPPPNISRSYSISVGDTFQNYEVNLVNNLDGSFSFPLTFNWGGDLNISLDLGGLNYDNGNDNDGGGSSDTSDSDNDVGVHNPSGREFVEVFPEPSFEETEFTPEPPDGTEVDEELEEVEEEDESVEWVLVSVSTAPTRGKAKIHASEKNVDHFAGFFSWTISVGSASYRLEELPIRKARHAFKKPDGVTGYNLYAVNGAKLKVTKYIAEA